MIFVFTRGRGQEKEELGEGGQKVHISSYKINKYYVLYLKCVSNVLYLKTVKSSS